MGYVLQSAGSAGRVKSLVLQGRFIIAVHRAFVPGCEGPSIAELCSVASRVRWDDRFSTARLQSLASPFPAGLCFCSLRPVQEIANVEAREHVCVWYEGQGTL